MEIGELNYVIRITADLADYYNRLWLVTLLVAGVRTQSTDDLLLAALVPGVINALIRPCYGC